MAIVGGVPFRIAGLLALWPNACIIISAAFGADLAANPATWVWTDITADVRQADGGYVSITPMGRSDETSTAQPAGCTFELDNLSGKYTAYNPASTFYPNVRRNTPIKVEVNLTGNPVDTDIRFQGQATGFKPTWDVAAALPVVTVAAQGKTRQLSQGKNPIQSPLTRATLALSPRAYWPLEGDGGALTPSTPPMLPTGAVSVTWNDAGTAVPGSLPGAKFGNNTTFPATTQYAALSSTAGGTNASAWTISGWFKAQTRADNATGDSKAYLAYWNADATATGTSRGWYLRIASGPGWTGAFDILTGFGGAIRVYQATAATPFDGQPHHFAVVAEQTAPGTVRTTLYYDGVGYTAPTVDGNPASTYTLSPVSAVNLGGAATDTDPTHDPQLSMVGVSVFDRALTGSEVTKLYSAGFGYPGELATDRLTRLGAEQGVPITITGTSTTTMGPQGIDAFLPLLRECETADLGVLYDGQGPGLGYVTRDARYNASAALTADMAASPPQVGDPFEPVDDDQRDRNVAKVDRKGGSSYTYEQTTGPKGTGAIGVYDTSLTVNVNSDSAVSDYASWITHLGTVEGFRYPRLNLDLAAVPALAASWLAAGISGRIDVTNVISAAPQHPVGAVRLLLEGWAEQLSPFDWTVQANTSQYAPWQVGILANTTGDTDPVVGHAESDGATVTSAVAVGAASFQVTTPSGPLWTTVADDFPLDIVAGGQRIRIGSISGASSPQTFTVQTVANPYPVAYPVLAGAVVEVFQPLIPVM